jgi:hypothetical protein
MAAFLVTRLDWGGEGLVGECAHGTAMKPGASALAYQTVEPQADPLP